MGSGDIEGAATTLLGSGDTPLENIKEINELEEANSGGMPLYKWPEEQRNPMHGTNPDGSTPGATRGDYPLEYYDDGFPKLPACLDRRQSKLRRAA
jgi:hypothetical protein